MVRTWQNYVACSCQSLCRKRTKLLTLKRIPRLSVIQTQLFLVQSQSYQITLREKARYHFQESQQISFFVRKYPSGNTEDALLVGLRRTLLVGCVFTENKNQQENRKSSRNRWEKDEQIVCYFEAEPNLKREKYMRTCPLNHMIGHWTRNHLV